MNQSRQLIAHGHIAINGRKVSSPSYLVLRDEEEQIEYAPKSPLNNPDHPITKAATIPAEPMSNETEEKEQ
jgi:small subunit ribosomal protein S4